MNIEKCKEIHVLDGSLDIHEKDFRKLKSCDCV